MAGFGAFAPCAVFPFCRRQTLVPSIMAGLDQTDHYAVGWVFLVTLHLALCSFVLSSGPRCSASWPVRTRRTVTRYFPVMTQRPFPVVHTVLRTLDVARTVQLGSMQILQLSDDTVR